jgi:hypothetical protein
MVTPQFIILGLLVAQVADALTFAIGVSRIGIEYERNAVAAALYALGGIGGVMVLKVVGVVTAIGLLVYAARRFPRVLFLGGATGTSLGLLGFLANTATVLTLT